MKKRKNNGFFVTFEGGEGCGKTTLINRVYNYLILKGHEVIKTREPGATQIGASIRDLLLHKEEYYPTKRAELLLFLADRAQHVEEIILPALARGKVVLCDRFNDSTLAYQGAGRCLDQKTLESFCLFAVNNLIPDLTLFLDLDPKLGLIRAERENNLDRLEKEDLSFHRKVREAFLSFSQKEPERFHVIDAMLESDAIFEMSISGL